MHRTRPPLDVSLREARALLDGTTRPSRWGRWGAQAPPRVVAAPGVPAPPDAERARSARAALQSLRTDPDALALLPGSRLDPTVQPVRIGGVNPLRSPQRYPLTVPGRPPAAVVTVAIGGDVMMDRSVGDRLATTGDWSEPWTVVGPRLARADIALVNLESTLAQLGPPTQGIESFAADPRIRQGLVEAGVDVVNLANNHSGDFGPQSLLATIDLLQERGLTVFGAGADRAAADRPAVVVRDGVRVAFVGFNAIGETPPAGPTTAGASALSMPPRTGPLDQQRLDALTEQVARLARRADVVVVVPHWGDQYTAVPVPEQSLVGRALLDAGADIVVGGHPHWVQGIERRGDRLLLHSLGNLVFDMTFSTQTQEGVVAELMVWDDRVVGVDLLPYVISPTWVPEWVDPAGRGASIMQRIWQASPQPFASLP
jgi:poly-gamma-glutamate synthesis protein (capsule biosynthesis protein)